MKVYRKVLTHEIEMHMRERPCFWIKRISAYHMYDLVGINGQKISLSINYVDLDPMPMVGDRLYLSENIIDGMKENGYVYTFSTRIGEVYARQPHDFLVNLVCSMEKFRKRMKHGEKRKMMWAKSWQILLFICLGYLKY